MILSIKGTVTVDSREDNKHGLICISLLYKRMLEVQTILKTVLILYTEVQKINSNLIKQLHDMSLYLSEDEIFSLLVSLPSTRIRWVRKRLPLFSSQMLSMVQIFENAAVLLYSCRWM